jgi:hypothetical protein
VQVAPARIEREVGWSLRDRCVEFFQVALELGDHGRILLRRRKEGAGAEEKATKEGLHGMVFSGCGVLAKEIVKPRQA